MNLQQIYKKIALDSFGFHLKSVEKLIKMEMFLSFLTVKLIRSHDHLGSGNGWTLLENSEKKLIVRGGIYEGIEYLDSLQYGTNLHNSYNNYVNPFFLFDILTENGKQFFRNFYKPEMNELLEKSKSEIIYYQGKIAESEQTIRVIADEFNLQCEVNIETDLAESKTSGD